MPKYEMKLKNLENKNLEDSTEWINFTTPKWIVSKEEKPESILKKIKIKFLNFIKK